ncbi:MAG: RIO1 family regulatory kinase/ATPase [Chloroflexota bacterium]|nr:RIO1 family regulatory kinase/ATPase [Chloroflexota bacterium]
MSTYSYTDDMDFDSYTDYEARFDPLHTDRQARRKRKPKANHTPKKDRTEIVEEIAQTIGLEGGFKTTYHPSLFEEGWLLKSLQSFYDQALITDVLARVKGGKEANVYRCAAHDSTGLERVAAKVYRPNMFRNMRNDATYREGRMILNSRGLTVKENESRVMRALAKKTAFGQEVAHTSWLMHEYGTLSALYTAGASVPKPLSSNSNAILMGYVGDADGAAPTLSEIGLDQDEAEMLFDDVMRNIRIMLDLNMVHGDLSAYNILYWEGAITLIDFPQVIDARGNSQAEAILRRDLTRLCAYFRDQGVRCDADVLTDRLWTAYMNPS